MTKVEELRERLIKTAQEHWNPNGGFYLTVNALIAAAKKEGAGGSESASILAKVDGDHWRFIGLPIVDRAQAQLECDFSTGEHIVRIMFAPPFPKEVCDE